MRVKPDFFLSAAGENQGLTAPRACWVKARLSDALRNDHMFIDINPPLIGQRFGLGAQDITHLILSPKYEGVSLFPVEEWPCHVYVSRIVDDTITTTLTFTRSQIEVVAWGMIFCTVDEAVVYARNFQ